VERDIFPRDIVFNQLKEDFVLVEQFTDDKSDPVPAQNLREYTKDGGYAVPLYIVTDSQGRELDRLTPPGNIANLSAREFADFLERAKAKFATGG
jgi:hypothetical protein